MATSLLMGNLIFAKRKNEDYHMLCHSSIWLRYIVSNASINENRILLNLRHFCHSLVNDFSLQSNLFARWLKSVAFCKNHYTKCCSLFTAHCVYKTYVEIDWNCAQKQFACRTKMLVSEYNDLLGSLINTIAAKESIVESNKYVSNTKRCFSWDWIVQKISKSV